MGARKAYVKSIARQRLSQSLLDVYDFMKDKEWMDIDIGTFRSFGIPHNYVKILKDGKIIQRRPNPEMGHKGQYMWIGPRPTIHTINELLNRLYKDRDDRQIQLNAMPELTVDKKYKEDQCAKALGEFYMQYRESTTGDLQTFIIGFNAGWEQYHNTHTS